MLRYRINRSHPLASGLEALFVPDSNRSGQMIDLVRGRRTVTCTFVAAQPPTYVPPGGNGLSLPSLRFDRTVPNAIEYPNLATRGADPLDLMHDNQTIPFGMGSVFRVDALPSAWQGIFVKNRESGSTSYAGHYVSSGNVVQLQGTNAGTPTLGAWGAAVTGASGGTRHNAYNSTTGSSDSSPADTTNADFTGAIRIGIAVSGEGFTGHIAMCAAWLSTPWVIGKARSATGRNTGINPPNFGMLSLIEEVRGPVHISLPQLATLAAGIGAAEVLVTVTHTAHGYTTGQKVMITGANEGPYNGIKTITVVDANTYTYTAPGNPSTPATGTIKSHRVILDGDADTNGVVQDTGFNYTADIAVSGIVRRASGGTYYKPAPLSGTVGTAGLDVTAFLSKD